MRTLKILAVVLVTLALGAAASWLWIQSAADRKWAAAQERIRQLSADHPVVLPPMPSAPAPKELQIHFVAAIRMAVRRTVRMPNLVELQEHMGTASVQVVIDDAQEFLERVHQGARQCAASPSDFPPGWRGEWDTATLRHMVDCCVLRARQLREQNHPFEAAESLLDALQLGRFWTASGSGDGRINALQSMETPLHELLSLVSKETLTREQLVLVEHELGPLDQALPSPVDTLDPALARFGETLAGWKELSYQSGVPYRWRYFLPFPLMKAQGFEFADRAVERLRADASASYPQLLQSREEIDRESRRSKNPIIADGFWFVQPYYWVALHRMAQVRLLRTAARYRATGDFLTLKDPFGDQFRRFRTETRMKLWSLDEDGVDHGGDRERDLLIEVDHPKPE